MAKKTNYILWIWIIVLCILLGLYYLGGWYPRREYFTTTSTNSMEPVNRAPSEQSPSPNNPVIPSTLSPPPPLTATYNPAPSNSVNNPYTTYTTSSVVSPLLDDINNILTTKYTDQSILTALNDAGANPAVKNIMISIKTQLIPLIIKDIKLDMNEIYNNPTIKQYMQVAKYDDLYQRITSIQNVYLLKIVNYISNYVTNGDTLLDPDYLKNMNQFMTNINTMITVSTIQINTVNTNRDILLKNLCNNNKSDLNDALVQTFAQNNPTVQNPKLLLQNIFSKVLQMANEMMVEISHYVKYKLLPTTPANAPDASPSIQNLNIQNPVVQYTSGPMFPANAPDASPLIQYLNSQNPVANQNSIPNPGFGSSPVANSAPTTGLIGSSIVNSAAANVVPAPTRVSPVTAPAPVTVQVTAPAPTQVTAPAPVTVPAPAPAPTPANAVVKPNIPVAK